MNTVILFRSCLHVSTLYDQINHKFKPSVDAFSVLSEDHLAVLIFLEVSYDL